MDVKRKTQYVKLFGEHINIIELHWIISKTQIKNENEKCRLKLKNCNFSEKVHCMREVES